jgi:hypothetical protein
MNATHDKHCLNDACETVRENCASQLTAPIWDAAACEAEDAWVMGWALAWLGDGTKECFCLEVKA